MICDEESFLVNNNAFLINELFNKTVTLVEDGRYTLPSPERMFKESSWKIKELQTLKVELNEIKNLLNSYDLYEWHMHTSKRNKAGQVLHYVRKHIKPEFLTQAWCKFYEILSSFDVVPQNEIIKSNNSFTSVHLCEAPGAFITSLNHWLKTNTIFNWNWLATTLNPYYEENSLSRMINDERFIRHTLDHWYFGKDNTGNLMDLKNLDGLIEQAKVNNNVLLVTADGSINCIDCPGEQEIFVTQLHYCETIAALHLLNKGGSFVIKMFTIFEYSTICILYLLACCFCKVSVTKPATSKEGNSESYIVCLDFKGPKYVEPYLPLLRNYYEFDLGNAMFCKNDIDPNFLAMVIKSSKFFKEMQTRVISNNIKSFSLDKESYVKVINQLNIIKEQVAEQYLEKCNLFRLPPKHEIVGKVCLSKTVFIDSQKYFTESYDKRHEKAKMPPMQQLQKYFYEMKNILDKVTMATAETFQLCDENLISKYTVGKTFHKIYNSRFCETIILNIQTDIEKLLHQMNLKISFPSDEDTNELLKKIYETSSYKTLTFRYTDIYSSFRFISKLYEVLQTLSQGDNLVIIGYTLLTHLNISLLYLLMHIFDILKLKPHEKVGCIIILKNYKNNANIMQLWRVIYNMQSELQKEGKTILSPVPIIHLYDWVAYSHIVQCNHWIIKTYLNYVMEKTLHSTKKEIEVEKT